MAIQFARCEYVSRSTGANACRKASYNQREEIRCDRTGELFSFKDRDGNVHHEILLPEGANEKFKSSSVLWNEVETCERRVNSQLAKEFVLALPDDKQITLDDRIELTRRFASEHFVENGLAVQMDIHEPHEDAKNWHAHLLVTTRRFSEDGLTFQKTKARDLDPTIRKGLVIEADIWGEHWRDLQNAYFEEKGYDIRVDPIGILAQEHLGPVRMRHHLNEALSRSQMLQKVNQELAQNSRCVLEALTRTQAIFSERDIDAFLKKHVVLEKREHIAEGVLTHKSLMSLYDKDTGQKTGFYSTKEIRAEEEKLIRFADSVSQKSVSSLSTLSIEKGLEGRAFTEEQHKAYDHCVTSKANLCLIQGRAGVGKSYVLDAIRKAHESDGCRVLGLAPTHKVVQDLNTSGFKEAKTCHSFLFSIKNNQERINANTVVIIDEAGMLGTELSVELFHKVKVSGAKLILVGDDRQLSSVDRGGVFKTLIDRYPSVELTHVRRQCIDWQKQVSEDLSRGDVRNAIHLLQDNKCIEWKDNKEEALISLLKAWETDLKMNTSETRMILAQKNIEVDALNEGARDILKSQGKLGQVELTCQTQRGKASFAEGDRIQLTKTDKYQGLINGNFGIIESINSKDKTMTVHFDNGEKKEIKPQTYNGLRHGYASTIYKAQGSTLDHVYVLHSNTTNQATSYVALTRQTKSLSLFVSKDETPNERYLAQQMSRQDKKGLTLAFDTEKEIKRKLEDKTLSTQIRDKAETLITKVKDTFHRNPSFYKVDQSPSTLKKEVTVRSQELSPALQKAYEEMNHPAFTTSQAHAVKVAFEKGIKIHGEEKAIAYWESKKGDLLKDYHHILRTVKKEMSSPFLRHLTDHWKADALRLAKTEPNKVLNLITQIKEGHYQNSELKVAALTPAQLNSNQKQALEENAVDKAYLKFKSFHNAIKDLPKANSSFKQELKQLSKDIAKDNRFMTYLHLNNPQEAKIIQNLSQEKDCKIFMERDRGGLSL